jgi:hypothetical protein
VLFYHHPVLVLVFKQRICLSLTKWLGNLVSFSSVFQWQLLSQLFPLSGMAVWVCMLSSGSREQFCIPLAILLQSCIFTVLDYWGLVSLSRPNSLGQGQKSVSRLPTVRVLWWFADCFSILQYHLTWMLLTGSRDEFCGLLSALFQVEIYHWPAISSSVFLAFVYWNLCGDFCPSPILWGHVAPSAACFRSLLYCSGFLFVCFLQCGGQSAQGVMLISPRGGCGIPRNTWCSPVGLLDVSQAGLELASNGAGTFLFSQCNTA